MNRALFLTIAIAALVFAAQPAIGGDLKPSSTPQPVKPGDHITKENAARVADLVSPGNYVLVRQGMEMNIVADQGIQLAGAVLELDRAIFPAGEAWVPTAS